MLQATTTQLWLQLWTLETSMLSCSSAHAWPPSITTFSTIETCLSSFTRRQEHLPQSCMSEGLTFHYSSSTEARQCVQSRRNRSKTNFYCLINLQRAMKCASIRRVLQYDLPVYIGQHVFVFGIKSKCISTTMLLLFILRAVNAARLKECQLTSRLKQQRC